MNVPTTPPSESNQPVGVPVVQVEGGEAVAEPLPLQQFIRNVPRQSDGSLSPGDSANLGKILEGMSPEEVNAKDDNDEGQTALHHVARRGLKGVVARLMKHGAIVSAEDAQKNQPLLLSCQGGFVETTTELLKQGAKDFIDAKNSLGQTALHFSCIDGRSAIVKVLLKYKVNTNVLAADNSSPIFEASIRGHLEIVQLLLSHKGWDKGLLEQTVKATGRTPLHAAVYEGHDKIAEKLLESGSKLDICDSQGWTPLMAATKQESVGLMKRLLQRASQDNQLEIPDKENFTPLGEAAAKDFLTGVYMLIKAGANCTSINIPNEKAHSILVKVSSYGHDKIVELFLKNETKIGLSQEAKGEALQAASKQGYDNIVKQLIDEKVKTPIDFEDQAGMTALHHAIRGVIHNIEKHDEDLLGPNSVYVDEKSNTGSKPGKHYNVAKLLLGAKAKPGQKTKGGETALHLAVRSPRSKRINRVELILEHLEYDDVWAVNNKQQTALNLAFEAVSTENQAADWAMGVGDVHDIARLMLKRKVRAGHDIERVDPNDWSAIELAAYHALPEVLAFLLVNSTSMKETMKCIDSAKKLVEEKMSRKNEFSTRAKSETATTAPMPQNSSNAKDDWDESTRELLVMDILNDPQIVIIKDSESYQSPQPERGVEGFPKDHSASIFQFYAGEKESSIIQRFRTVQQVIYDDDKGPKKIMEEAVKNLKNIYGKMKSRTRIADPGTETETETEPKFTWVHLSSTNDALKRILKDEGCSEDRFRTIKSFFQNSWAEIPDNTSPSRFMRPQHSCKSFNTEKNDQDGRCTALYIPYLSFARYCRGQCSDHCRIARDDNPRERSNHQKLHEETRRRQNLVEAYRNQVIHGPSTLDEWYYQFAAEVSWSDDAQRRNKTQVVTKSLRDNTSEGKHWRLVQVNQLWAWVVGNKWLITATWDPIDGIEETLPQGIIDHIRKQAKVRGKRYQPHNAFYMSKLLVDFCIGSYERARIPTDKDPEHEQQVSIRQIFSNYMNTIGRDETLLFEISSEFSLENCRQKPDFINDAIKLAKEMSCQIKDIRDELNILKSVAQYQREVEEKLSTNSRKTGSGNASLRANYVIEDISQMDTVSLRIQSSISETLSLEQSEIANLQATLSVEQGTRSVEQGTRLMVFTIVTVVFLPLSFLASFFAMDTEAFQKSALWAKLLVFLVTLALVLPFYIPKILSILRDWLTRWRSRKDKRMEKLLIRAKKNTSTDPEAISSDLRSRTPSEVEEAATAPSIRRRDTLAMRFRKSDSGRML
ncbi:unnamed protein product [Clonostachys solani]|uniref:Ankyrin repeat protein n=1 Tax=Clonostachys solani TaxID=160281 RepID=A0A9N9Z9L4_9HYPO|nr:unnamed protein product [Clonostachys solani]